MQRLLIVDDEPQIGSFIGRIASNLGYAILAVSTPDRFIEHVRAWSPTHIMMDLKMPNMDGLALLSHLAAEKCLANIILMSGMDRSIVEAARRVALERGLKVTGTLTKPFRVPELKAVLQTPVAVPWPTMSALTDALERKQMYLHYQPKIALASDNIVGVEALIRWLHPERGPVSPSDFIPLAESSTFVDRITTWLTEQALCQLKRWNDQGIDIGIAINVSARNLHDPRLADTLDGQCRAHGIDPECVTLELTETAAMKDAIQMMDLLVRLRIKGFKLSIDDFGTGYSSLVQLRRLPFCEIKIDRSFVADCATSSDSRSIVRTIVSLAHDLGMMAVAEGVESAEGLALLRQLKCDHAQGYFIARPAAADDLYLKPRQDAVTTRSTP